MKRALSLRWRLPDRSWRAPGVKITSLAPRLDPAFDIDGLPDPFTVYWPVFITNLYDSTIYVTSLLVSPPGGWTDSEQNLVPILVGGIARTEKSNSTRAIMATPHNETITVRYNYRTGSYAGPIIGFDDFAHPIYWESISAGTIDDTDDFETDYDGWARTVVAGTTGWGRTSAYAAHGAYSLFLRAERDGHHYIQKTLVMGAGTRAYLFGFIRISDYATPTPLSHHRTTMISPVETLEYVYFPQNTWRRWGCRLNPDASNQVTIHFRNIWGNAAEWSYVALDYLRWVRY